MRAFRGGDVSGVMIGDWSMLAWVDIFWSCHSIIDGSVVQWQWPDGGGLFDQPAMMVTMMSLLRTEAQSWVNDTLKAEAEKARG